MTSSKKSGPSVSKCPRIRFGAEVHTGITPSAWAHQLQELESSGYSSVCIPDHYDTLLSPLPALAAAACYTTSLNLSTYMLANDFRHPTLTARDAATVNEISQGRLELGIGAGWKSTEYESAGIRFESASERIARLAESVTIIRDLLTGEEVSFSGRFFTVSKLALVAPSSPMIRAPKILIGGGSRRVLALAATKADVVGINVSLPRGILDRSAWNGATLRATQDKIRWVQEKAGTRFGDIELNLRVLAAKITNHRIEALDTLSANLRVPSSILRDSPHVIFGTEEEIVSQLHYLHDELAISYFVFSQSDYLSMMPIVRVLSAE